MPQTNERLQLFYTNSEIAPLVEKFHNARISTYRKVPSEVSKRLISLEQTVQDSEYISHEVVSFLEEMLSYLEGISDDLVEHIYIIFLCLPQVHSLNSSEKRKEYNKSS